MKKELINENADALQRQERVEQLRKKYAYRTTSERLEPFRRLFGGFTWILQLLSALLAAGGVLLLSEKFAGSFLVVAIITILLLLFLEAAKRLSYDSFNTQRIAKEPINKVIIIFCVFFAALSVFSSYIGAPHTVEFFAAKPSSADTLAINTKYNQIKTTNAASWLRLKAEAEAKADKIHSANNWRGTTSRQARPVVLEQRQRAATFQDSLFKYAAIIESDRRNETKKAEAEAAEALASFAAWRSSFSSWLAAASLFFEVALFIILFWIANHNEREIKEFEAIESGQRKDDRKIKTKTAKDEVKDSIKEPIKDAVFSAKDEVKEQFKVAEPIGFKTIKDDIKDGVIIPAVAPKKAPRVQIVIDGGKLKQYTAGGLRNLIKNSTDERAAELSVYLEKIKNYEK